MSSALVFTFSTYNKEALLTIYENIYSKFTRGSTLPLLIISLGCRHTILENLWMKKYSNLASSGWKKICSYFHRTTLIHRYHSRTFANVWFRFRFQSNVESFWNRFGIRVVHHWWSQLKSSHVSHSTQLNICSKSFKTFLNTGMTYLFSECMVFKMLVSRRQASKRLMLSISLLESNFMPMSMPKLQALNKSQWY